MSVKYCIWKWEVRPLTAKFKKLTRQQFNTISAHVEFFVNKHSQILLLWVALNKVLLSLSFWSRPVDVKTVGMRAMEESKCQGKEKVLV